MITIEELAISVWLIELFIIVLIVRTRRLVMRLLDFAAPWMTDGEPTEGYSDADVVKIPIRGKNGRIVRWEPLTVPARSPRVSGGLDADAESGPPGGPPGWVADLAQKYRAGTLSKSDVLPHLPEILSRLKGEFTPGSGGSATGGSASGDDRSSRFG